MVLALQLLLGTAGFGRNALFYSLVFLHALAALAGFGSIGFAGTYAAGAYLPGDRPEGTDAEPAGGPAGEQDAEAEEMRRYFAHPARLWGCLVLVPFLGAGALAAQPDGKGFDHPWVFGALAVWLAATLVAGSLVVPSLHQMQAVLLKSDNPAASPVARSSLAVRFARAGRITSRSAAFCDVLFLVALALMIFRP